MIKLWTFCKITLSHCNIVQSGFRSHSTDSCLSNPHNKITKGFVSGLQTGMVFIDLQKAVDNDLIDNNILIKKIFFLGFTNEIINWYISYISQKCLLSV